MRDIAEQVAAWENETTIQALTSDERQRVYIPLYQSHLPKLDEEGIIEYNQSRGTVERTKLADQLDQYLTVDEQTEEMEESTQRVPWESYYLGVSVFSTILLAGAFSVSQHSQRCQRCDRRSYRRDVFVRDARTSDSGTDRARAITGTNSTILRVVQKLSVGV